MFEKELLISYIARYTDAWNRHRESKNTKLTNMVQVRNFINFKLKGFSTRGERDTIFLCWLLLHRQLSTQPTRGARSAQIRLALTSPESQPSSSVAWTQLPAFFSNFSLRFRCMTSLTSPGLIFLSGIFILTPLNDTSSPCAR